MVDAQLVKPHVVKAEIRRWRMQRAERAVAEQLLQARGLENAVGTAEQTMRTTPSRDVMDSFASRSR